MSAVRSAEGNGLRVSTRRQIDRDARYAAIAPILVIHLLRHQDGALVRRVVVVNAHDGKDVRTLVGLQGDRSASEREVVPVGERLAHDDGALQHLLPHLLRVALGKPVQGAGPARLCVRGRQVDRAELAVDHHTAYGFHLGHAGHPAHHARQFRRDRRGGTGAPRAGGGHVNIGHERQPQPVRHGRPEAGDHQAHADGHRHRDHE